MQSPIFHLTHINQSFELAGGHYYRAAPDSPNPPTCLCSDSKPENFVTTPNLSKYTLLQMRDHKVENLVTHSLSSFFLPCRLCICAEVQWLLLLGGVCLLKFYNVLIITLPVR